MTLDEFCVKRSEFRFDFDKPMASQPRVVEPFVLDDLPVELEPTHPYHSGSRGRPNLNQTRTHSQCAACHRVLRNDFFYTPPSLLRRNVVYANCRECAQRLNAERYSTSAGVIRHRRHAIWRYLAPSCALCGFDRHPSALELHCPDGDDAGLNELVTSLALTANAVRAESLLSSASRCVPLCSNCHRLLHAGAVSLPPARPSPEYQLAVLMQLLGVGAPTK